MNESKTNTAAAGEQSPDQQTPKTKPKKKAIRYREFHQRRFLNLPTKESDAYISVHMENGSWDNYSIRITDCNGKIILHGKLKTIKSRKNALYKVDSLMAALQGLRRHMTDEFKRHDLKF